MQAEAPVELVTITLAEIEPESKANAQNLSEHASVVSVEPEQKIPAAPELVIPIVAAAFVPTLGAVFLSGPLFDRLPLHLLRAVLGFADLQSLAAVSSFVCLYV